MSSNSDSKTDPKTDSSNGGSTPKSNNNNNNDDGIEDNSEPGKDLNIMTEKKDDLDDNNMFNNKREFKVIKKDNGIIDASRSLSACLEFYCSGGFGRVGSEMAEKQLNMMNRYIKEAAEPLQKRRKKNNKINSIVSYEFMLFFVIFTVFYVVV